MAAPLSTIDSLLKELDNPEPNAKLSKPSKTEEKKEHHHHHSHNNAKSHKHSHQKTKKKDESIFNPTEFWSGVNRQMTPYVFVSPMRYVMGDGVFDQMAHYLSIIPSTNPAIIITATSLNRFAERLKKIFTATHINIKFLIFEGQCLFKGADQIMANIKSNEYDEIDCVLSIGGGKIIDVGKLVAKNLKVPMISIPTIASNEASCSALSIIHCSRRGFRGLLSYKSSPELVMVDSGIIAQAPLKYFVAGVGDAMATYYETMICNKNPNATNCLGGKICLSTMAMAKVCKDTLWEYALIACDNIENNTVSSELEKCIEANTLMSGIGFESGGIALAHAIAHSMTVGARKHKQYMHGEEVSVGLMTQLAFENNVSELKKMGILLTQIGLPISYKQLRLDVFKMNKELNATLDVLFGDRLEFRNNQIGEVNRESVLGAMRKAETCAAMILIDKGQQRFKTIHNL